MQFFTHYFLHFGFPIFVASSSSILKLSLNISSNTFHWSKRKLSLSFSPFIPDNWTSYSFKIKFRNKVLKLIVNQEGASVVNLSTEKLDVLLNNKELTVYPNEVKSIA